MILFFRGDHKLSTSIVPDNNDLAEGIAVDAMRQDGYYQCTKQEFFSLAKAWGLNYIEQTQDELGG